jgi:DNA polymerase-3 subunit delta'
MMRDFYTKSQNGEKKMFSRLYGNEETKKYLQSAKQSGRLAHAYLIEGEEKSGKHLMAMSIAAALAGDLAFRVWEGTTPDVITYGLSSDRKTISVDLVRKIKESVYLKPTELSCKVYIIEQVDTMTVQAQNALLKLLEEPPAQVYFLLLCQNASLLLPTVRSRAQLLRTERFSEEHLKELLLQKEKKAQTLFEKDPDAFAALLSRAKGSYGIACQLLNGKSDAKSKKRKDKIRSIFADLRQKTPIAILGACARLSSAREDMVAELEEFCFALRDLLFAKQGVAHTLFWDDRAEMQLNSEIFTMKNIVDFYDSANEAKEALMNNANVALQQTVLSFALIDALQLGA